MMNEFIYVLMRIMNMKQVILDKFRVEIFLKIIYGNLLIDEFDNFVVNWKKFGGDQIIQEVNEVINVNK